MERLTTLGAIFCHYGTSAVITLCVLLTFLTLFVSETHVRLIT